MIATNSSPTKLANGTGIPLPRLSKTSEAINALEGGEDIPPTPPMIALSSSKAFVPLKLKIRRVISLLFRIKARNKNFI